jgi:hypothetical protein
VAVLHGGLQKPGARRMKIKKRVSPAERKLRRDIERMAAEIPHDAALKAAIERCEPAERNSMLRIIAPYLSFIPSEENLACAMCGAFRGAILGHECDPGGDEVTNAAVKPGPH